MAFMGNLWYFGLMTYHIITFGCQMNKSDSERIASLLEKNGYKYSPTPERANLVVINMCSVRQSAVNKCKNKISCLHSASLGKRNKNQKIILTGCVLEKDKNELSCLVDLILPIKNLPALPKLLLKLSPSITLHCYIAVKSNRHGQKRLEYLEIKPKYQTFPKTFVPISFGCSNYCTYCVVPYTRGKEIHRPKTEILKEVRALVKRGYKQIILLGENVNNYPKFTNLLREITAIKGDFTLSFLAANPSNFTDELIDEIAKNTKLEKYIHLPLQSGDNKILKKMKRPYTAEQFLKLAEKIKKKIPDVKIATDIIVGFPGETKKAFQNTVNIFKKAGFHQAYIAKYSPRPGTAAFLMKDDVPIEEKKKRENILRQFLRK